MATRRSPYLKKLCWQNPIQLLLTPTFPKQPRDELTSRPIALTSTLAESRQTRLCCSPQNRAMPIERRLEFTIRRENSPRHLRKNCEPSKGEDWRRKLLISLA